ncbi:Phosphatidylinositol N-acetylglucosaminyltransferase subunit Q [Trichinella pseudospiralis]|uniref:Phosphatidylinositol N-acetylglucosaminyltransferase subunit Q n=1 Tax=Trichinella pseudospiralis TaxID=6337 RepID=A0A0V1EJV2_TRIPS|nr:Phosphatidylinositol N-acetylglucosaminyltransferase subunit Q [Trichinella pseudospiralis]
MNKDGFINIVNELRNFLFKRILLYDAVRAKLDQINHRRWSYLLIDFLVGLSLFLMMRNATFVHQFAENCEIYIMWIQRLIEWLMGAPGGLKLNKPLNTALGSFFIYHITLWRRYLYILRPLIHFTALSFNYASLFGISISLAVLYDSISLFTVHVFCFYVYAGRIFFYVDSVIYRLLNNFLKGAFDRFYQLQLNGLISLGRLFRGKKYNPLRNRVDSCCFDKEQLLLGTVAFTIFFFLLPTIFTYYVVFSSLRLIVFVVQSLLLSIVRQFQFNRCSDEESGLMWSVFKASKCVLFGTLL